MSSKCYSNFLSLWCQEWRQIEDAVQTDLVPGFGKKLSSILDTYLEG